MRPIIAVDTLRRPLTQYLTTTFGLTEEGVRQGLDGFLSHPEHERFVQAAEVLEQALRSARDTAHWLDEPAVTLRFDLANVHVLAGDYRTAEREFDSLARDLSRLGEYHELAEQARRQASACRVELGDAT